MLAWILLIIINLFILKNLKSEKYTVYVYDKDTKQMFETELNEKQEVVSKKEIKDWSQSTS
tara:strand:+ start:1737 stop:1919 length:183 start_codon:yes stop_codon:yes gene_type:complete